ncbi:SMP-30/gluconolactonase/LRE family protein [Mobilitalea sibirica]|uniref:SMP-30/gluconolactonase/LRE family protein n=1 Tax=Mobilitalea sibirica TaxID=1462919 RepID=A0A8J7KZD0_9FIRM|nr:SMP-30/gluconolactonase/LRE family protein [Mobilitalea sibirica]MBH1939948.1 SMP-30/gluconolactonase/LRE family protein [Mobilitalea sibirica]
MIRKKHLIILLCIFFVMLNGCSSKQEQKKEEVITMQKQEVNNDEGVTITPTPEQDNDLSTATEAPSENGENKDEIKAEIFADLNGKVGAGIIFDNDENMFVAKDGELVKVTPSGEVRTFCSLQELPKGKDYYFNSPLIWDMTFDQQGNILAAAQDRILHITPEGTVSTLIREDFKGFLGASGIEFDKQGNFYITNGSTIDKYTPDLAKTTFIDSSKGETSYSSFFSLEFDPDYNNLYVTDFNSKSLLKYSIDTEGNVQDNPEVIIKNPIKNSGVFGAPLNITFSDKDHMYVSIDGMAQIMKIDNEGGIEFLKLGNIISNHIIAFGGKGFDEESIYITTFNGKNIYRYKIGERGAMKESFDSDTE